MSTRKDLSGQRFGRLTVVAFAGVRNKNSRWLCRCDCGAERVVQTPNLRSGNTTSCGCWHREHASKTHRRHGESGSCSNTPEYRTWKHVTQRCHNPTDGNFHHYGARGITVCDRWRFGEGGMSGYECFIADMGRRPSPKHSIDRIDNSRGYSPDNCRWATHKEQARNTRSNRMIDTPLGKMCVAEAAEAFGIAHSTINQRLRAGWPESRLFTPARTCTASRSLGPAA